eukprot:79415-Rhodomonas_salina.1
MCIRDRAGGQEALAEVGAPTSLTSRYAFVQYFACSYGPSPSPTSPSPSSGGLLPSPVLTEVCSKLLSSTTHLVCSTHLARSTHVRYSPGTHVRYWCTHLPAATGVDDVAGGSGPPYAMSGTNVAGPTKCPAQAGGPPSVPEKVRPGNHAPWRRLCCGCVWSYCNVLRVDVYRAAVLCYAVRCPVPTQAIPLAGEGAQGAVSTTLDQVPALLSATRRLDFRRHPLFPCVTLQLLQEVGLASYTIVLQKQNGC